MADASSVFVELTLAGCGTPVIVNLKNIAIDHVQRSDVGTLLRSICGKQVFVVVESPKKIEQKRAAARPIRPGTTITLTPIRE